VERSTKLYYSIAEVAEMAAVKAHVLRYWETEFPQLRPKKNRAGNRTYRERDVKLVLLIKRLLYEDGFTIRGALKRLREKKNEEIEQIEIPFLASAVAPAPAAPVESPIPPPRELSPVATTPAAPGRASAAKVSSERATDLAQVRRELESILADLSA